MQEKVEKWKLTFDQLLNKYTKAILKDRALKKESSSSPRQGKRYSPRRESSKHRRDSTIMFPPQKVYATMPWAPLASDFSYPAWEHEGFWMYCYPMLHPPSHYREEDHRRPVFDRVTRPVHDRLRPHQSGKRRQPAPVRPVSPEAGQSSFPKTRVPCQGKQSRTVAYC